MGGTRRISICSHWSDFTTSFDYFVKTPLFSLVVYPCVFYAFVKPDPLQRSHSRLQPIRFFQAQFPSLYLKKRCAGCLERDLCPNFIGPSSSAHTAYWLTSIFRPEIGKAFQTKLTVLCARGTRVNSFSERRLPLHSSSVRHLFRSWPVFCGPETTTSQHSSQLSNQDRYCSLWDARSSGL